MAPPGHPLEHHGLPICQYDDGSGNPANPVTSEALRVVLVARLGERVPVDRRDHRPGFLAGRARDRCEEVDAGRKILPRSFLRPGPSSARRDRRRDNNDSDNDDNYEEPDTGLTHPTGTAAAIPIDPPLSTP